MSNINQTSKNLKKKLSLDDYSKTSKRKDGKAIKQQAVEGTSHNDGKHLNQHVDMPVKLPKTKSTFYLDRDTEDLLTAVYIQRLQERRKTDKSALICEAIELLYQRENSL